MRKRRKSNYWLKLLIVMLVYTLLFCVAAYKGLQMFWDYIAAYEASRPQHVVDAYMEQLDDAYVQEQCAELIGSIDHNIQSEEQCRQAIADALREGITYAKKSSESTDHETVYMLLSGKQTIGRFVLTAGPEDTYGFASWSVTEESFDLSYLVGQGVSITAPCTYPVYVNGVLLGEDYIAETNIHYDLVEQYYETCDLPYKVVYEVAAIMGELDVVITTPDGTAVTQEEALEDRPVLNNCTEAEIAALDSVLETFLGLYVKYVTNTGSDIYGNYTRLSQYIIADSSLAARMNNARDGLNWVRDRGAFITGTDVPYQISLGDGRYLCDVTYTVEYANGTQVTETVHIIFTQTQDGLKAESMISY